MFIKIHTLCVQCDGGTTEGTEATEIFPLLDKAFLSSVVREC